MQEKYLGKISSAEFGLGGYQDATIGLHLGFEFNGSYVSWCDTAWSPTLIPCNENTKWSEDDRSGRMAEIVNRLDKVLNESNVKSVKNLVGIPVEVIIDDGSLVEWRILTEVL
jgi:hypothetical protein